MANKVEGGLPDGEGQNQELQKYEKVLHYLVVQSFQDTPPTCVISMRSTAVETCQNQRPNINSKDCSPTIKNQSLHHDKAWGISAFPKIREV